MALRDDVFVLHAACKSGELEAAKELLDRDAAVDLRDEDGYTALMWACLLGRVEVAKLLLVYGAEVDLQKPGGESALMWACLSGHVEVAKLLLDRGANVDLKKTDGRTALMWACQNGQMETPTLLLDRGAHVNMQATDGWTALMSASKSGRAEVAELLLDRGAEVDLQRTDGQTALMSASEKGHAEVAELLLDRGAKADLQELNGWTALTWACQEGHEEIAELLLGQGAKADLQANDGSTPLMLACRGGHEECAELLLDRGAKADLQATDGSTPLMLACQEGHEDTAELLLDRGAKVDLKAKDGLTALVLACQEGHEEATKLLLDRGAKVDLQAKDGLTALMWACHYGETYVAELLLDRGAKLDLQDSDGWTALTWACQKGEPEAAMLLLDQGARADLQANSGSTLLMLACQEGHKEIAKLLLDRGAEVDLQVENGRSALMYACQEAHTKTAKLLLDCGAKVDLQDTDGWTALMWACENGDTKVAKLLLNRGAKVNLQTKDGFTALMSVCENGGTEVTKLLLDRGAEVNLQKADGWTALMSACEKGFTEVTKVLLDSGAKADLQAKTGRTPLMLACREGHTEAAKLLFDCGARADVQDAEGLTALMSACDKGHTEVTKLLLDRGAKADLQAKSGWTSLMFACREGRTEAAKLLLDCGARTEERDTDGLTALMLACQNGRARAAKLLLDRGAKADLQARGGWTPLMLACQEGHAEVAELLLDRGAKVDLRQTDGLTSLMLACRNGHAEAAKLLLDRGAKVNMQDAQGNTALVRAMQGGPIKLGRSTLDQRSVSIISLLCTRSIRLSFADLGGPAALAQARRNRLLASAELLEFISDASPLAPYKLRLKDLACLYARNVRTPQAAADLSSPELFFMGLKDTEQRHQIMERFRNAAKDEHSGVDTLEALALKIEYARDAHKRGQDAIDSNLEDLSSLLSSRPCALAASHDFDVAMNTVRETKRRLEDLQARVADDIDLVDERNTVRDELAALMSETDSGGIQYSIQRLEKNDAPAAAEVICHRVWARLSDKPLTGQGDHISSNQDIERACRDAGAAIATWKQRDVVIKARSEVDTAVNKLNAAAQALGLEQTWFLMLGHPMVVQGLASELEAVKGALKRRLRALQYDDPMNEVPLAEIRRALELVVRRHAKARQTELARCRAAVLAMKTEVDELVKSCSKPSTTAVEDLIYRIEEVQRQREVLEMNIRHARSKRLRAGTDVDADKVAELEDELANLPGVYTLDRELRQERARVIRHVERYFPELLQNSKWCAQIGLSSEALIGVGALELWLASVTRADFAQVKALAIRPGKEVYEVTDPDGRVKVLKSFHLADDSWHGRFYRQVQALAELKSAYLVHVEALFLDAPFGCIVMPYYAGGDLAAWIRDNPHASDETRKRIAVGVLSGVHDLHQHNLVHCDIKPENIFLTQALTPVLGDFDGIQMSDVTMTQPLQTTVRYVAPELRADGVSKVAPAVDLFSVGVVLGEIFPKPSDALQDLIGKLQADDPAQRPSALEALGHEAFHTRPMRSSGCQICMESYPETEGLCCESEHFVCKTCLGATVRAAAQPGAHVQLKRDCSMPCVAPGCECELPGSDLAMAVPDEFETLLKIVREHFERETAADTEKELQRRLNEALREHDVDPALREHVEHIQNKLLTLSCPRCETAFVDFDGCCALQCSNPKCARYFCAWCLQDQGNSDECHAHVANCAAKPADEADAYFSERSVVERAWCKLRASRVRLYIRRAVTDRALKKKVREIIRPHLTEDLVGLNFRF